MKKSNFMQGAFIATLGIVVSKILGILYVIPFYAIIGEQGGALYGYAYNIYAIFLGISTAGLPLAMSKMISEYHTLGYFDAKRRTFQLGRKICLVLGVICFILLFAFAPLIAKSIIGDLQGGNSVQDVTMVLRVISTAVLIVPTLSVYRGYLEGHKFITATSISQVVEQVVRVIIIVLGSFLALKVFHLSLSTSVGIAVFAATVGAFASYFYLLDKVLHNKKALNEKSDAIEEPKISSKQIIRKLIAYSVPFIMIDVFKSIYNSVDMVTLVKTLVDGVGYSMKDAESIMSVISTWGSKLNMIVLSIATGCMVSLIPNLTASYVKKDMEDVRHKINQTLQILLYVTIPMAVGLSLLAKPVWMIFYGPSEYGASVVGYYIFVALATALFTASITIVQLLRDYKQVLFSLLAGLLVKVCFNIPLIYGFHKMGLPAYYGAITASILGFLVPATISLVHLKKKCQVSYEDTVRQFVSIMGATLVMVIVILLLRFIVPSVSNSRMLNIPIVIVYTLIGGGVYFFLTYRSKTLTHIFGQRMVDRIFGLFKRKRVKK